MKYIIAIIRPHKLEDVKRELDSEEVHLMTVSSVIGCGRQKGLAGGAEFAAEAAAELAEGRG